MEWSGQTLPQSCRCGALAIVTSPVLGSCVWCLCATEIAGMYKCPIVAGRGIAGGGGRAHLAVVLHVAFGLRQKRHVGRVVLRGTAAVLFQHLLLTLRQHLVALLHEVLVDQLSLQAAAAAAASAGRRKRVFS